MQNAANGGGGIFKTAAAEILRAERRLMSTGEAVYPGKLPEKLCLGQSADWKTYELADMCIRGRLPDEDHGKVMHGMQP